MRKGVRMGIKRAISMLCIVAICINCCSGVVLAADVASSDQNLTITQQPEDYTGDIGSIVRFEVKAEGKDLSYQWQLSDNKGTSWYNSSIKTNVYTVALTEERNGRQARCIITDGDGHSVISDAVTMKVAQTTLTITQQPEDYTGDIGSTVRFEVKAEGKDLSYQWQLSDNKGTSWYNSSIRTNVYTVVLTEERDGRQARCVITDADGDSITSDAVTMRVDRIPLTITQQPEDYTGDIGSTVRFEVKAEGKDLSYQWQLSDNKGTSWYNSSIRTNVYTVVLTEERDGRQARCVITDRDGTIVISDAVTMRVDRIPLTITQQPEDYTGDIGSIVRFEVKAEGKDLSYQWQLSDNKGTSWYNSSIKTNVYTVILTEDRDGRQARCVITDGDGTSVTSDAVTMRVDRIPLTITQQPEDYTGDIGSIVRFEVKAEGKDLSYQWQLSDNNGTSWYNSSIKTNVYTVVLTGDRDGRQARCIITDGDGNSVTSDAVTMRVDRIPLTITQQPEDYTGDIGSTVRFEVKAEGKDLSYQWQLSDNKGTSWYNSSIKTNVYTVVLTEERDGRQARCIITDGDGTSVTSDAVTMRVDRIPLVITQQPEDYTGDIGSTVRFEVKAEGKDLSYQWQLSDNKGTSWYNSSIKTNVYTVVLTEERDGRQARCVITDRDGTSVTSDAVTMRANKIPLVITQQPEDYIGDIGSMVRFEVEAEGRGLSYQWQLSDNKGTSWYNSSIKTSVYTVIMTENHDGRQARCVITDADGDSVTSDAVTMSIYKTSIIRSPEDYEGISGDTVVFTIDATGPDLTYQWQYSLNQGATWATSSITGTTYSVTLNENSDGRYVRCIVTDKNGYFQISEIAVMRISTDFSTGFMYRNGGWSYRYEDGSFANGLVTIEEDLYYFISKIMRTGFYKIGDHRYFFDEEKGYAITGLKYVEDNKNTYYFQGSDGDYRGLMRTPEGIRYFDNTVGIMQTGAFVIDGLRYHFNELTGLAEMGLYKEKDGNIYFYTENGAQTGWVLSEGKNYYFNDETGQSARGIANIDGDRYYFDINNGNRVENGLVKIGQNSYVYLADGICTSGLTEIDGDLYYFSPSSFTAIGGFVTIGESMYYFNDRTFKAETGFVLKDGKKYFFNEEHVAEKGLVNNNGHLYYFSDQWNMLTGLITVDGQLYYFDDETGIASSGWYFDDSGKTYYFDMVTNAALIGWHVIDNKTYYFNDNGILVTGLLTNEAGEILYYAEDNEPATGWTTYNGNTYYFDDSLFTALTGLKTVHGKLYYFDQNGIMRTGILEIEGKTYYFDSADGAAQAGFIAFQTGYIRYFDENTYAMITGLKEIAGEVYYFDENGIMTTGYRKIGQNNYFFAPETGKAQKGFSVFETSSGMHTVYGNLQTGVLLTGKQILEGELYIFRDDGTMRTGLCELDGKTYYLDPATGKAVTGFVLYDGKVYYFDETKERVNGVREIDNNLLVFTAGGNRLYGLVTDNNIRYILDSTSGIAMNGIVKNTANGNYYGMVKGGGACSNNFEYWGTGYFADQGGLLRTSLTATVNSLQHYYNGNGEREYGLITYTTSSGVSNRVFFGKDSNVTSTSELNAIEKNLQDICSRDGWYQISGTSYYVKNGTLASGIVDIDGIKYGFSSLSNTLLKGLRNIDGNYYYFDDNGKLITGMVTINGDTRYFEQRTGIMATGFTTINGESYYFLENGVLVSGVFFADGCTYSATGKDSALLRNQEMYDADGVLIRNYWGIKDGQRFYLDGNGNRVKGKVIIDGISYIFDAKGWLLNGFCEINGNTYFGTTDGITLGWLEYEDNTYYFDPRTGEMLTGIRKIDDYVYYFNENGILLKGFVTSVQNNTYYFTATGALTGWQNIDGHTYYFDGNGVMKTGMLSLEDQVYYFSENGKMQTGWVSYLQRTYYFDPDTGMRKNGLTEIDGDLYYLLDPSGIMMTGKCNIGGKLYYFDSSTGKRVLGFVNDKGNIMYYDDSAQGFLTGWHTIDGSLYSFAEGNGIAMKGLRYIDNVMYYFDENTGASISGIFKTNEGDSYYINAGGGIDYGLKEVDGNTYYFWPSNGRKIDGLQSIGENLYYFDAEKGMLKNTSIQVDGLNYMIDENGIVSIVGNSKLAELFRTGMQYLGQEYKTELEENALLSCSGLVRLMFESIGITGLNDSSFKQWYNTSNNEEYQVIDSMKDAKPGDLIFYVNLDCPYEHNCNFWNEIHHVGVYMGDGKIMEAASDSSGNYPELNCIMVDSIRESETFFVHSIIRILD